MEPGNQVAYNTRSARKRRAQSPEITTGKALEETKVLEHKRKVTKKTKFTNEEESTTTEEEKVIEKTVVVKKKAMEVETVEKTVKRGRGGSKKAEDNKSDEVVKSTSEEKSAKKRGSKSKTMEVEDEKKTEKIEEEQVKKKREGSKKVDNVKEDEDGKEKSSKKKDKKTKEKKEEKSSPKKRSKSTKKGKKGDDSDDEEDEDKKEKTPKKKSKSVKKGKKDDDSDEDEDEDKKKPSKKRGKSEKKKKSKKESDSETEDEDKDKEKKGKKGWKKWGKSWKKGKKDNDDENGEKKKRIGRKMNRNRAEMVGLLEKYTPVEQTIELGDGKIEAKEIVISSWNVNGLCTILKYTTRLQDYVKDRKPDILCLNETKLSDTNIKGVGDSWIPEGYYGYFNCCKIRKWYSGTAIISKHKPISVKFDIGIDKHGLEGRTITLEFENFYLVSTYVPNSGGHLVGVDYRVKEWDPDLRNYLNDLKTKKHVIVCGDLNVVHEAIDIYNIENKEGWPGVSPGERKEFGELLNSGFVDTFRHLYPDQKQFSFYCKKLNHRPKNLGWRLDYFLVDKDGLVGVKDSLINNKIYGSDHVPIELVLNPEFK